MIRSNTHRGKWLYTHGKWCQRKKNCNDSGQWLHAWGDIFWWEERHVSNTQTIPKQQNRRSPRFASMRHVSNLYMRHVSDLFVPFCSDIGWRNILNRWNCGYLEFFFWLIFFRCTQLAFFVKCVWVKMLVNLSTWAEIESVGMWKCTACFVFTRTYIESAEKLFPRIGSRDNSHNPLTPDLQKDRTL